ncbi:MAG: amidase [Actinomycetota bacterium]|nr:amidase [Actinomycetota bacterium]
MGQPDRWRAFITETNDAPSGRRLAVKDLFDTAGIRTTYGSAIFRDHVPTQTAEALRLLEAGGWVTVGKTNLHEFAYGITSQNPHFGDVVNPLDRARTPGGSSGGSAAALAAGLCDLALGTDSAGSIRIPAACCGITGFKPTHGLVPTDGVFPLAPSFDTAGPMAQTVRECTDAMALLAPGLRREKLQPAELDVGVAWLDRADPLVAARVDDAAEYFPRRRPIEFPLPERTTYAAFMREAADVHRELFARHRDLYGDNVRTKIERCLLVNDEEVEAAHDAREAYRKRAEEALGELDLLLIPTLAFVAPPVEIPELDLRERMIELTYPFNHLGWPALALPCGPAEHGLPASVSLVGRPGADALVLATGERLERELSSPH